MKFAGFFIILILLIACQSKKKTEVELMDRKISVERKLELLLQDENQELLGLNGEDIVLLKSIYSKRSFHPFWLVKGRYSEASKILIQEFGQLISYGLPQNRYKAIANLKNSEIINEVFITKNLLQIVQDLNKGFFIDSIKKNKPLAFHKDFDILGRFSKYKLADSLHLKLLAFGTNDSVYQKLAHQLYYFTKSHALNDSSYNVPTYKKDTLNSKLLAIKALKSKQYLQSELIDSITFIDVLKRFQKDNVLEEDGKIGQHTADALNETNLHRCQRAALVLEKLRWKRNDYKRLVLINIPEYVLRFYYDDTLRSEHNIIVGKEDKQTPELSSKIYRIVALPYWSVPFSITSEEFLPILKHNPNYLTKNNMKLYRKDVEVDPQSVNWKKIKEKTFPFKVIQQPGNDNSLGIIKFEFKNKHSVYVHDTPTKRLFKTKVRSYSHGCMRCQFPDSLGKLMLLADKNKVLPDSLDTILNRRQHLYIPLKKRIPIVVEYLSVVVNNENNIIFLRDIYKRDEKYLKEMF
jgi:L,D-transpeptidase YcbB